MHGHDSDGVYELSKKRLIAAILITFIGSLMEIWGSVASGSIALWSDAWHMLADSSALIFSLVAIWIIKKFPHGKHFGKHHSAEVLAAVINCLFIFAVDFSIFWRIYQRLNASCEISCGVMLAVSIIGLLANLLTAWCLWLPGKHTLNIRSAFWHVLSDSLCSLAVIAGAAIILATGLYWLDIVLSAIVGLVILLIGLNLAKKIVKIFKNS
jgi:cobalt-zinc-cadmium efflux system protein